MTNSAGFFCPDVWRQIQAEGWKVADLGEERWTGGGRCCVGEGDIVWKMVTLET